MDKLKYYEKLLAAKSTWYAGPTIKEVKIKIRYYQHQLEITPKWRFLKRLGLKNIIKHWNDRLEWLEELYK